MPLFTQKVIVGGTVLRTQTQEYIYEQTYDMREHIKIVVQEMDETRASILSEISNAPDDAYDNVRQWLDELQEEIGRLMGGVDDFVANCESIPDGEELANRVDDLVEAVRLGSFREPKTVPEFALQLDDALRDCGLR